MWKPPIHYIIAYNNNGGIDGPSAESGETTNTTVILNKSIPTKTGYAFVSWCSSNPDSKETCNGDVYNPGGSYPLSRGVNPTLYAVWKLLSNGDGCSSPGWTETAKYYGGYCWMWKDYKQGRTYAQAITDCPSDWSLPSERQFQALLNAIGSGSQLYSAGWNGNYWSSTYSGNTTEFAYGLYVQSNKAQTGFGSGGSVNNYSPVRCATNVIYST